MILSEITSSVKFKETVNQLLLKKKQKYEMFEDYYEGCQWTNPGIRTRFGNKAVDLVKSDKSYFGVVLNLIKDSVDTYKNLSAGTNGVSSNISDVIDVNFDMLHDEIVEQILVFGKSYVKMERSYNGSITVVTIEPDHVIKFKNDIEDENGNLIKYEEYAIIDNDKDIQVVNTYAIDFFRTYIDGKLVNEVSNDIGFVPVFEIGDCDSFVKDLIQTQDMINISLTQEFEVNKFAGDPLTVVNGMAGSVDMNGEEITKNDIRIGSGELLLTGTDMSVERIDAKGITDQTLEAISRYKKDLYKIAKLGALKNDDLSGVTSGYAIEMKLLDTTAFVKKIRSIVKSGFKPMFDDILKSFGIEVTLNYSDIFPISTTDKIDEAIKLNNLGLSKEFILKHLGLSENEITKELLNTK